MSKSESRQKTVFIQIRCTDDEAKLIKMKAKNAGVSTSDLLRKSALNRKITVKTDIKMMNELLRLGGLQKHLYNEMQKQMTPELSKQFSDILVSIRQAINEMDLS
ncbi:plasmid mobilization protein MobA [Morganella psychrotolerans]|uniref:plasmid mobilization protein MobA n=1 Tax=Morganella psychrotolerans TaxID=368603 RepID=UPI0039AFF4F1